MRTEVGLAAVLLAGGVVCAHAQEAQRADRPALADEGPALQLDDLDAIVRTEALERGVPGVGVAVVSHGEPLLVRGYGWADVARRRDVTAATPFNIASVSKSFTSAIVLRLVARGEMSLDARIGNYLAWIPEEFAPITIRQLLTHTSGIVRDVRQGNEDDPDEAHYRARILQATKSAAPGERYEYSNTGYAVLGFAAEAVSGLSYGELLRRELFDPFEMLQASYRAPVESNPERARPYTVTDGKALPAAYVSGGFASGGIALSAADFAAWAMALQREEVLAAAELQLAWSGAQLASGDAVEFDLGGERASYGCGWFVTTLSGHRLMTHGGGITGFSANLYHFPDDGLTIAVVANAKARNDGQAPVDPLARRIAEYCLTDDRAARASRSPLAQVAAELRAANRRFSAACIAGDTQAIAALYAPDALMLQPSGIARAGSKRIAALFAPNAAERLLHHALYTERLHVAEDFAVEIGTCYDSYDRGGAVSAASCRYMMTWRRGASGWVIAGDSWVSPPR